MLKYNIINNKFTERHIQLEVTDPKKLIKLEILFTELKEYPLITNKYEFEDIIFYTNIDLTNIDIKNIFPILYFFKTIWLVKNLSNTHILISCFEVTLNFLNLHYGPINKRSILVYISFINSFINQMQSITENKIL